MAHLQGHFYSKELSRSTHFHAILSNDNAMPTNDNPNYTRPVKNVYLLHGFSGCDNDWPDNAPLNEIANELNLNIFTLQGDNNFYVNSKASGHNYQNFTGKEFVEYTRKTFSLSDKKEDTIIGGLSMGGYGALHTGLAYPETFGKIIALSSALIIDELHNFEEGFSNEFANYEYYAQIFGDLKNAANTELNPKVLIEKLINSSKEIPSIYIAIGTEDFLLKPNRDFRDFLLEKKIPVSYNEGPGNHNFEFWREWIVKGLNWALN